MNAADIRREAEKRIAEIEAEAAELRAMLGRAPAPQAPVFVPMPWWGIVPPTSQPWVDPYRVTPWHPVTITTTGTAIHIRARTQTLTTTGQVRIDTAGAAPAPFIPGVYTLDGGLALDTLREHGLLGQLSVDCACGPGGLDAHRAQLDALGSGIFTYTDDILALSGLS